jgi:hypothetical protein
MDLQTPSEVLLLGGGVSWEVRKELTNWSDGE